MNSNCLHSSTTRQEIIRVRHCGPNSDELVILQNALICPETPVSGDGLNKLHFGDKEIIFKPLIWLKDDMTGSLLNEASLLDHIHHLGQQLPGVHLYDCLLEPENEGLIPFFPPDVTLVFLGSTAFYALDTNIPVEVTETKPKKMSSLGSWISSWFAKNTDEATSEPVAKKSTIESEVCFFALARGHEGKAYPWFIPLKQLIQKIEDGDDKTLVMVARPLK